MTDPLVEDLPEPLQVRRAFGPISSGVAGRLWTPEPDEPVLAAWWRPLAQLSRRLRADLFHWPINLDEFDLVGRVDRLPLPRVWVYRHHRAMSELAVDDEGRTYEFRWSKGRRSLGRLKVISNRSSIHRAQLTDVIESISYRDELYEARWAAYDD
jgi:hypothetical protein